MTNTNRPIRRALVSVFHKEGIEVLAEAFIKAGTEVVSTGSTAKRLAELGVAVTEVSEVTGFPECLDGRVKTLDPHIHAGILADMTNPDHAAQLEKFGIKPFDLVVVNLYPFADTVRSGADEAAVIEKIDIGGPSMVRGAAKNSATVAIVTDPTHLGIGSHDRGDVTALRDDAAAQRERVGRRLARNVGALRGDEHVAHRDDVRHLRHVRGDLGGADGLTDVLAVGGDARMVRVDADVEVVAGEEFGDCFGDLLLIHLIAVEVDALMQAPPGACAVHGAGIEVGEAEMAGQRLRSGGLSDARRAVDGDSYHSPTSFCRERTSTWDSTR